MNAYDIIALCGLFAFGAATGSFGNVVIWRIPPRPVLDDNGEPVTDEDGEVVTRRGSVNDPKRSHCPNCNHQIAARDNIPILSWFLLRGKCRNCKEKISFQYAAVEILMAALFVAVGLRFGYSELVPAYVALVGGLLMLSVIDLELYLLPNRIVYPTGLAVAVCLAGATLYNGEYDLFWRATATGLGAFVVFFIMHFIYPAGMGFGDVRLSFVLGMSMGYLGVGIALVGFFAAYLLGAVAGVGVMLARRGRQVPFGPFLATGTILAIFWGQGVVDWYLSRSAL